MADGRATIKDLYELVDKKQDENNSKVDSLRKEMNIRFDSVTTKLDAYAMTFALQKDMESVRREVRALQNFRWYLMGGAGFLIIVLTLLAPTIRHFIFGGN